jgi:hypothetical protein
MSFSFILSKMRITAYVHMIMEGIKAEKRDDEN